MTEVEWMPNGLYEIAEGEAFVLDIQGTEKGFAWSIHSWGEVGTEAQAKAAAEAALKAIEEGQDA